METSQSSIVYRSVTNATVTADNSADTSRAYALSAQLHISGGTLERVTAGQPVPTGTAPTLPVMFGSVRLLASNGAQATVADIGGAGATSLVLVYFNSRNNRLQLVGRYGATAAAAPATPTT